MRRSMAFDPQKSQINTETMSDFLRAELSLELTDVPGIGDKTKRHPGRQRHPHSAPAPGPLPHAREQPARAV